MQERGQDELNEAGVPVPSAVTAATPAFGRGVAQAPKVTVDAMPFNRSTLAGMSPEERAAIYLNQIRKMMIFFTVLAALGILAGIIVGIIGIDAIHQADQGVLTPGF